MNNGPCENCNEFFGVSMADILGENFKIFDQNKDYFINKMNEDTQKFINCFQNEIKQKYLELIKQQYFELNKNNNKKNSKNIKYALNDDEINVNQINYQQLLHKQQNQDQQNQVFPSDSNNNQNQLLNNNDKKVVQYLQTILDTISEEEANLQSYLNNDNKENSVFAINQQKSLNNSQLNNFYQEKPKSSSHQSTKLEEDSINKALDKLKINSMNNNLLKDQMEENKNCYSEKTVQRNILQSNQFNNQQNFHQQIQLQQQSVYNNLEIKQSDNNQQITQIAQQTPAIQTPLFIKKNRNSDTSACSLKSRFSSIKVNHLTESKINEELQKELNAIDLEDLIEGPKNEVITNILAQYNQEDEQFYSCDQSDQYQQQQNTDNQKNELITPQNNMILQNFNNIQNQYLQNEQTQQQQNQQKNKNIISEQNQQKIQDDDNASSTDYSLTDYSSNESSNNGSFVLEWKDQFDQQYSFTNQDIYLDIQQQPTNEYQINNNNNNTDFFPFYDNKNFFQKSKKNSFGCSKTDCNQYDWLFLNENTSTFGGGCETKQKQIFNPSPKLNFKTNGKCLNLDFNNFKQLDINTEPQWLKSQNKIFKQQQMCSNNTLIPNNNISYQQQNTQNNNQIQGNNQLDDFRLLGSPYKSKKKAQQFRKQLYCNQKRVPTWAADLNKVNQDQQEQKKQINPRQIFGKFIQNNVKLDELFGNYYNSAYDKSRGSSANWHDDSAANYNIQKKKSSPIGPIKKSLNFCLNL